jgi:putative thioredoxin
MLAGVLAGMVAGMVLVIGGVALLDVGGSSASEHRVSAGPSQRRQARPRRALGCSKMPGFHVSGSPSTMQPSQPAAQVFDVTPASFQGEVVERSKQAPVILLFWAQQMLPSVQARRRLEELVQPHQGKVFLALVDVARDPTLAQHLRVQALPGIRVVEGGQLVHQLDGAQSDATLQGLVEQLTLSPADMLREDLGRLIEAGDFQTAMQMLVQAIQDEPKNPAFRIELADVLLMMGDLAQAEQVLAEIPADTEGRERPQTRLELLQEAAGYGESAPLEAAAAAGDLEARYRLAILAAAAGACEAALEHAMTLLSTDRTFRDDLGRVTMLRIFNLLGKGSELATRYRRRMFNLMH